MCVCVRQCMSHKALVKVTATFKIWKICDLSDKDRTESIEVAQREDLFDQIITYECIFFLSITFSMSPSVPFALLGAFIFLSLSINNEKKNYIFAGSSRRERTKR